MFTPSELSPRQAAKATGAKTYVGSICSACSGIERRTDNGACIICHRAAQTRWKAANPSKVREHARQQRARKLLQVRALARARYAADPEKYRRTAREYAKRARAANPEKFRIAERQRYAANPERKKAYARDYGPQWLANNPGKARARDNRRRSRGQTATPRWLKESGQYEAISALYREAKCTGMHVDHDCPLAGCRCCGVVGLHVLANLQLFAAGVNRAKGNRCMACFLDRATS